jgi:hypothetical protein
MPAKALNAPGREQRDHARVGVGLGVEFDGGPDTE